jgi:predicted glycoside hydrolase/deacetylase ChbG (UPF0249 family)
VLEGSAVAVSSIAAVRLVVNADGFGMTPARSKGALLGHRNGIVTSTSVLGNAADLEQIRHDLGQACGLGVGVQLTLVGGTPVAKPEAIPSLVGPKGEFPQDPRDVLWAWAKATLEAVEIEREFDAQIARLRDMGLIIDHLCTKDHLGFLPIVAHAVENVARRHGIAGLRMAVEKPTLAWTAELPRALTLSALAGLAWLSRRQLGARRHGPQTWGYFESGRLDEVRVLEILGRLGPGGHELICQPDAAPDVNDDAHNAPSRSEVAALTSLRVREAIQRRNIELCRWSDLF